MFVTTRCMFVIRNKILEIVSSSCRISGFGVSKPFRHYDTRISQLFGILGVSSRCMFVIRNKILEIVSSSCRILGFGVSMPFRHCDSRISLLL